MARIPINVRIERSQSDVSNDASTVAVVMAPVDWEK
jgi:hypothetical protein